MTDLTQTMQLDHIQSRIKDAQSVGDVVGAVYDLENYLKTKAVGESWKNQFNLESSERQGIEDAGVAAVVKMVSFGQDVHTALDVDQDLLEQELGELSFLIDPQYIDMCGTILTKAYTLMKKADCLEAYANRVGHDERFQAFIRGDNKVAARFLLDVIGSNAEDVRYAEFTDDSSGISRVLDAYVDTLKVASQNHSDDGLLKTEALGLRSDLISEDARDQLANIAEAHAQKMQDVAMSIIASYDEEDRARIFGSSVEEYDFDDIEHLSEDDVISFAHRLFTEAMIYGRDFIPFASEEAYENVSNQYYLALATVSKMEAVDEICNPGNKEGPLRSNFYFANRKRNVADLTAVLPEGLQALAGGLRAPLEIEDQSASHSDGVS